MIKKRIKNSLNYKHTAVIKLIDAEFDRINPTDKIKKGFIGAEGIDENCFNESWYKYRVNYTAETYFTNNEKKDIIMDLDDFIVRLKKHNITPVLFSSPTYSEYNAFLDKEVLFENKRDIQQLCHKHNIEYFDYMKDNRFSKYDFNDPDHLNKNGAKKFSIFLNQDIASLTQ
jgi:hypothetical protein